MRYRDDACFSGSQEEAGAADRSVSWWDNLFEEGSVTYTSSPAKLLTNAMEITTIPQQTMMNGTVRRFVLVRAQNHRVKLPTPSRRSRGFQGEVSAQIS